MIKIQKKTRTIISGLMVGLASLGALGSYFDLNWAELQEAIIITLAGFLAIVLLAGLAVLLIKLPGIVMRKTQAHNTDKGKEQE